MNAEIHNQQMSFEEDSVARFLYGQRDGNLRAIEDALEVSIGARGRELTVSGSPPDVRFAVTLLDELYELAARGMHLGEAEVHRAIDMLERDPDVALTDIFMDTVFVSSRGKKITPKTLAQKDYLDEIRRNDLVFGIGPAGTGKTFLAVVMALAALQQKRVRRIILTRPAVEAGERLGFLPGDLTEKVNPYLRPLLDALSDMLDAEKVAKLIEKETLEIAPLAFMRGRTLSDSFIILDEAQNTTREQMKMFLTRIGADSQAVITGDDTQIDLPRRSDSGIIEAQRVLADIPGIAMTRFTEADVVRHSLVQKIIVAYEQDAKRRHGGDT